MKQAEFESAQGKFESGESIGDIARQAGVRATTLAFKLLGPELGTFYTLSWNAAMPNAANRGVRLDADGKITKQAYQWAQYERKSKE